MGHFNAVGGGVMLLSHIEENVVEFWLISGLYIWLFILGY